MADCLTGVDAVARGGADDGADGGEQVCARVGTETAANVAIGGGRDAVHARCGSCCCRRRPRDDRGR